MTTGSWLYRYLAEAIAERNALVPKEKAALINAEMKLAALGPNLPYPHSSAVQGADRLRELRPRSGRSPWRALYRQVGGEFVIAAVGPEAQIDPRGFVTACRRAEVRLTEMENERR
jgi:hypothetical protein